MKQYWYWFVVAGIVLTGCARNQPPEIIAVKAFPEEAGPGDTVDLVVSAADPEHGRLKLKWTAKEGSFTNTSDSAVRWEAPPKPGTVRIQVTVTDPKGAKATKDLNLKVVKETPIFSGSLGAEPTDSKRSRPEREKTPRTRSEPQSGKRKARHTPEKK